ncbi:hypothetical protein PSP6_690119 [Paraburkholderia tropica]|nr:hypothetical protein PSP6_690119 [Paraburkholderia tropica]
MYVLHDVFLCRLRFQFALDLSRPLIPKVGLVSQPLRESIRIFALKHCLTDRHCKVVGGFREHVSARIGPFN